MNGEKQDIEKLRKRFEILKDKRLTAQADLRNVEKQLSEIQAEAREKYKTDDLGELREKLEAMRAENERKRAEYQTHLDGIDEKLKAIEQEHG